MIKLEILYKYNSSLILRYRLILDIFIVLFNFEIENIHQNNSVQLFVANGFINDFFHPNFFANLKCLIV